MPVAAAVALPSRGEPDPSTQLIHAEVEGTLDLRLEGKTKKPRFLRVWAPITLKGTLAHPKPGVDAAKAAPQLGLAVAVGAVLAPLAAILPFIEPGLAKNADCAALIAEAKSQGAPVKQATVDAAAAQALAKK